jgi:cytochrome c553
MSCHGPTGRGNPGPAYPSIAGQHANYTKDLLKRYRGGASFGKGDRANTVMAEVAASLSDQDIEALASYIEGLHRAEHGEAKVAGK